MKILAIIPARGGSKGIPNKNIRLLCGKPMITYAIQNALDSKYITDVIVSTDSSKIELICKQMGVHVHRRKECLCGDEVTLDAVIYDVIKELDADLVITLQPTSPTLRVETLDRAIAYMLENKPDTVISVINKPHLAWKEVNGRKVPNYKERLNRQYLPANYLETGAFVISQRHVVTEGGRIGEEVDVFEIEEDEAVDIDTYEDLIVAEHCLKKMSIAIWVNGNNQMGLGHIYRILEIADCFYQKPDIFYDINITNRKVFGETTHNIYGINGEKEFVDIVAKKNYHLIINDSLDSSLEYMNDLRKVTKSKIVNFEDAGSGAREADLVFNALYAEETVLENCRYGEKYYIIPSIFMMYKPIKISDCVKNIFVCFGGADPQNYTDRILEIATKEKFSCYSFYVVLGKAKNNVEKLMKYNQNPNISVVYDVENMPEIMSRCDIGVTSRGRTGYEMAALGIPTIAMAQNEREKQHRFISNDNGFIYLGFNPSDYLIESNIEMLIHMSSDDRKKLQEMLLSHNLKEGRRRVINLMEAL